MASSRRFQAGLEIDIDRVDRRAHQLGSPELAGVRLLAELGSDQHPGSNLNLELVSIRESQEVAAGQQLYGVSGSR